MMLTLHNCWLKWLRQVTGANVVCTFAITWLIAMVASLILALSLSGTLAAAETTQPIVPGVTKTEMIPPADLLRTWTFFSAEQLAMGETWKLQNAANEADNELVCLGQPYGYLVSPVEFENFQLGLEWKYPTDPNGNSGLFVYATDDRQIWPRGLQVQFHAPAAGSIVPSGLATAEIAKLAVPVLKPVNEWNSCVVASRDGVLTIEINGQRATEVSQANPQRGRLALQSEGAVVHFRRMWIKKTE
jgi:Domain of Unknown Function (DUF1080)